MDEQPLPVFDGKAEIKLKNIGNKNKRADFEFKTPGKRSMLKNVGAGEDRTFVYDGNYYKLVVHATKAGIKPEQASAHPEIASFGPRRRSRIFKILDIARLSLRF